MESDEEGKEGGSGEDPGLELLATVTKELDDESTIDLHAVQVAVSPQVTDTVARLHNAVHSPHAGRCWPNSPHHPPHVTRLTLPTPRVQGDLVHDKLNEVILDAIAIIAAPPKLLTHSDLSPYTQVGRGEGDASKPPHPHPHPRMPAPCAHTLCALCYGFACVRRPQPMRRSKRRWRRRTLWTLCGATPPSSPTAPPSLAASRRHLRSALVSRGVPLPRAPLSPTHTPRAHLLSPL